METSSYVEINSIASEVGGKSSLKDTAAVNGESGTSSELPSGQPYLQSTGTKFYNWIDFATTSSFDAPLDGCTRHEERLSKVKLFLSTTFTFGDRLETFIDYPDNNEVSSAAAVCAGFVALIFWRKSIDDITEDDDTLLCPQCFLFLSNIQPNINLLRIHTTESPECKLALEMQKEQLVTDEEVEHKEINSRSFGFESQLVVAESGIWNAPSDVAPKDRRVVENILTNLGMTRKSGGNLGIKCHDPKHLSMASADLRITSFMFNEKASSVDVSAWSKAGFFWTGYQDSFTCYYCGLNVNEPNLWKNPFTVHVERSPACQFVNTYDEKDLQNTNVKQTDDQQPTATSPEISEQVARRHARAHVDLPVVQSLMNSSELFEDVGGVPSDNEMRALSIARLKAGKPAYTRESEIMSDILERRSKSQRVTRNMIFHHERPAMKITNQLTLESGRACNQLSQQNRTDGSKDGIEKQWPSSAGEIMDRITCPVCYDELANQLLIPCTHIGGCSRCVLSMKTCPICGGQVSGTVTVSL